MIVSNATLQWVPGHRGLLPRLVGALTPGGWLAFQVPGNFDEPEPPAAPRARRRAPVRRAHRGVAAAGVAEPADYLADLAGARLPGRRLGDDLPARADRGRTRCFRWICRHGRPAGPAGAARELRAPFEASTGPAARRPTPRGRTARCCRSAGSSSWPDGPLAIDTGRTRERPTGVNRARRGPRLRLTPLRLADAADFLAALGTPGETGRGAGPPGYRRRPTSPPRRVVAAALTDPDRVPYAQRLPRTGVRRHDLLLRDRPGRPRVGHRAHVGRAAVLADGREHRVQAGHARRTPSTLGAERVVWHTDIRNVRSQEAIARLGAQREGVLRHHRIRRDGSWRDTVQFAMLAEEWPAVGDQGRP